MHENVCMHKNMLHTFWLHTKTVHTIHFAHLQFEKSNCAKARVAEALLLSVRTDYKSGIDVELCYVFVSQMKTPVFHLKFLVGNV